TGGRLGGGTVLTDYGRSILRLYDSLENSYKNILDTMRYSKKDNVIFLNFIQGLCMKTSARNHLAGIISEIICGTINSEIIVDIGDKVSVVAVITNESVNELALEKGCRVLVLVKASSVMLFESDSNLRCSIQNMLKGKVVEVRLGLVNGEVLIEIPGGKIITAVITRDSVDTLGLKEGVESVAAFSASNVILALPV
ncbi:MAG: TOBE domain-containing protein, partial [Fibrobacterota bacterium]